MRKLLTTGYALCAVLWTTWASVSSGADYRFPSREQSRDGFVSEFMATLLPGVIDRKGFIQWSRINARVEAAQPELSLLQEAAMRNGSFVENLKSFLLSTADPQRLLSTAFLLLGHTENQVVTLEDNINCADISRKIRRGDENAARQAAEILTCFGLDRVLALADLHATLTGVMIGLETHRRKNVGGKAFGEVVRSLLAEVEQSLKVQGLDVTVADEYTMRYADKTGQKRLDFVILVNRVPRVGIEVNFYTTSGSKPAEIKRSYADVRRRLAESGVALVWITDGIGYRSMQKSLGDAYLIHPNIYNLHMARQHWVQDFSMYLRSQQ